MLAMKGDLRANVDVGNPVAIGETERIGGFNKISDSLQSPAGLGLFASVEQRYLPRLAVALMDLHPVVLHVEGDI
jgi:UDP-3-O-[3-hydroxymyristoyl] glucosamine N-acyltransferase